VEEQHEVEHNCAWKRTAMRNTAGITPNPNISGAQETMKDGGNEANNIGINGITIVIHLEGKADLSPGTMRLTSIMNGEDSMTLLDQTTSAGGGVSL
jgi:hypothetical protein